MIHYEARTWRQSRCAHNEIRWGIGIYLRRMGGLNKVLKKKPVNKRRDFFVTIARALKRESKIEEIAAAAKLLKLKLVVFWGLSVYVVKDYSKAFCEIDELIASYENAQRDKIYGYESDVYRRHEYFRNWEYLSCIDDAGYTVRVLPSQEVAELKKEYRERRKQRRRGQHGI